jgi:chromosome segregation ATPase
MRATYFYTKEIVSRPFKSLAMKVRSTFFYWGIPAISLTLLIFLVAWVGNPQNPQGNTSTQQDTVPTKKRIKTTREAGDRDLDKELRQLDNAKEELDALSEKDWDKIRREIEESIKEINTDKIKQEVERSLKQVDLDRIQKEIEASLNKVDFNKIERDIEKAMKEVEITINEKDIQKELYKARKEIGKAKLEVEEQLKNKEWQKDVQEELQKVNSKEIEEAMENARSEMERVKEDMNLEKLNMSKDLDKARKEIEKAKIELKGYQEMIYSMEKQGLLNTKADYKIEYSNGELRINGKKQTEATANKYRKYFKSDKDKTTITKEDGDFNIDID